MVSSYGPLPKIPGKCQLGLQLGRVPQGGLTITFKPKMSQPPGLIVFKGIKFSWV